MTLTAIGNLIASIRGLDQSCKGRASQNRAVQADADLCLQDPTVYREEDVHSDVLDLRVLYIDRLRDGGFNRFFGTSRTQRKIEAVIIKYSSPAARLGFLNDVASLLNTEKKSSSTLNQTIQRLAKQEIATVNFSKPSDSDLNPLRAIYIQTLKNGGFNRFFGTSRTQLKIEAVIAKYSSQEGYLNFFKSIVDCLDQQEKSSPLLNRTVQRIDDKKIATKTRDLLLYYSLIQSPNWNGLKRYFGKKKTLAKITLIVERLNPIIPQEIPPSLPVAEEAQSNLPQRLEPKQREPSSPEDVD